MSLLKPEASVVTGLATAALVIAVYSKALPSSVDVRVGAPQDPDIDSARKQAAWTSAGAVAAVALIAQDATVFTLGGLMVIGMDWWTRHSNLNNPAVSQYLPTNLGDTQPTLTQEMQDDDNSSMSTV
jgi:hypothetical protein